MYNVEFYSDKNNREPVREYIDELRRRSGTNKDARINLSKIVAYVDLLEKHGTWIGEPIVKHLDGDIWELRPLANRFLFAYYKDKIYLLLHHFIKETQKTPQREINQAKRNFKEYIERMGI